MSGGHFDYAQHHLTDIAESIENYVYGRELDDEDVEYLCLYGYIDEEEQQYIKEHHHTIPNQYEYSKETLEEFKRGIDIIKQAEIYAQRIDWLLSGDDGEESFHSRLKEELEAHDKLKQNNI